ncbi:50S ribosomal protein L23 [Candidatus Micrarchaeota archaeon]|nr:50S ribosomal protein L23 [Candidatus Micrarchaeota archaeon]
MFLKPVTTEKAISGIELRNGLTFFVDKEATKQEVKKEVEKEYGTKVLRVNTAITPIGLKKAIVIFKEKGKAANIAAKMKLV